MSADLEADLRREFDAASPPSSLTYSTDSVLRQGSRTIRRRRIIAAGSAALAVAVVATGASLFARPDDKALPLPASSTGTTSPPSAAAASGTDLPFVSQVREGSFLTMNGRKVRLQLQEWWAVEGLYRAGDSVLLDVYEPDKRFTVRARADGSIIKIDAFRPPFALSADGRLVAGHATGIANMIDTPQLEVMVLVDALSGKELARVEAGGPKRLMSVSPELIMDPGAKSVLVSDTGGDISVWSTARKLIEPLVLGGRGVQGSVAANPDRTLLLITTDARDAARAEHENGRMTAWSWPDRAKVWTAPLVVDGPASFSPGGRFVAVPSQGRVALLDASSGRLVRQTDVLPDYDPLRFQARISISWEDASNFIAWDIGMDMNGRFRCAAATAACQPLNLGVGDARAAVAR